METEVESVRVRMRRTKVGLSALVLFCHVAAEVIIVEEKASALLPCPQREGDVIWRRRVDGKEVDILTSGVNETKHIEDPYKRYSAQADKSLHILRVTASDSGRYSCNTEAVELMVIPPGTDVRAAEEGTRVTLTCPPGPPTKTWSTAHAGAITDQRGFHVADQTLTITCVEMSHSGRYDCDGKPAVYLRVTKAKGKTTTCRPKASLTTDTTTTKKQRRNRTKTTPTTKPTTTTTPPTTTPTKEIVPPIIIFIIIIVIVFAWRQRLKKRGRADTCNIYEEIQEMPVMRPTNAGGSSSGTTATYCKADLTDQPQLPENPYCLLEKPKEPANHTQRLH